MEAWVLCTQPPRQQPLLVGDVGRQDQQVVPIVEFQKLVDPDGAGCARSRIASFFGAVRRPALDDRAGASHRAQPATDTSGRSDQRPRPPIAMIATHDLNLALRFCNHMGMLGEGSVLAAGLCCEVLNVDLLDRAYGMEGRGEQYSLNFPIVPIDRARATDDVRLSVSDLPRHYRLRQP